MHVGIYICWPKNFSQGDVRRNADREGNSASRASRASSYYLASSSTRTVPLWPYGSPGGNTSGLWYGASHNGASHNGIPSGYVKIAIENGHRNGGFSHWKWWFSIVMLVYQRVNQLPIGAGFRTHPQYMDDPSMISYHSVYTYMT
jgi:hypothetical protein